ncbi:hypothetical protein DXV76_17495 [Rhodobacteraceae bacterium CCMM004]|nr:hypothetical protein DXV76_17495 [Rhodobacteraceae bacterium CCMM004]
MTQNDLTVDADEWGTVRLFSLDADAPEAAALAQPAGPDAPTLKRLLGADRIDATPVQAARVEDLEGLGLAGFMTEGLGIAPEAVAANRARIDAVRGVVVVVPAKALSGTAQTLEPQPPLRFVGLYREADAAPPTPEIAPSRSAAPMAAATPTAEPAPAAGGGRPGWLVIAGLAVAVIVVLLVVL